MFDFTFTYAPFGATAKAPKKSDAKFLFLREVLQECAENLNIKHFQFIDAANAITLHFIIEAESEQMLNFANAISAELPLSLEYKFGEIKQIEQFPNLPRLKKATSTDPNLKNISKHKKDLEFAALDSTLNSAPQNPTHAVLCDISSLKTYFRASDFCAQILSSIEKPVLGLMPKEIFQGEFGDKVRDFTGAVKVRLPKTTAENLRAQSLLKEGTGYFLSDSAQDLVEVVAANGVVIPTAKNPKIKNLDALITHNLCGKFEDAAPQKALIFYLSLERPSAFLLYNAEQKNYQQALDVSVHLGGRAMLEAIKNYESGELLVANFADKFGEIYERLMDDTNAKISKNLLDIFEIAAVVLGSKRSKFELLKLANECLLNKGPRIDYKLVNSDFSAQNNERGSFDSTKTSRRLNSDSAKNFERKANFDSAKFDSMRNGADSKFDSAQKPNAKLESNFQQNASNKKSDFQQNPSEQLNFSAAQNQSGLYLDTPRIIRSLLSFRLAGVEPPLLAFGMLDSLAEFLATTARDFSINLLTAHTLPIGSLFSYPIVLDRLAHYAPNTNFALPTLLDF